ncbi:type II toxin-antitoxin system VapB family antitoxin [Sphingomonas sp. KR1UV-12]|uniref:Type II toxin-antitoxin system VapB family antitoxin n=1 Tax=Sphingomonas aurea TaxID=3063994 RepID=A0ABT9EF71_9SPHN|nr:type II toxin-antitoxin system VapB family antitoxin [Sphingomonas sp. KR1UV-12]MDP1025619.1 type II toxin-antitoxin system VapB family antitoxin [Sphingomonas sp. KR1UV-12]
MGVQLNIKDPETVRLARELADKTGRSITETIRGALEQAIAEREADVKRRSAAVRALVAEAHRRDPTLKHQNLKEVMDSIYDEDGLPA